MGTRCSQVLHTMHTNHFIIINAPIQIHTNASHTEIMQNKNKTQLKTNLYSKSTLTNSLIFTCHVLKKIARKLSKLLITYPNAVEPKMLVAI